MLPINDESPRLEGPGEDVEQAALLAGVESNMQEERNSIDGRKLLDDGVEEMLPLAATNARGEIDLKVSAFDRRAPGHGPTEHHPGQRSSIVALEDLTTGHIRDSPGAGSTHVGLRGPGFDTESIGDGTGLRGMSDRLKGEAHSHIGSRPGHGASDRGGSHPFDAARSLRGWPEEACRNWSLVPNLVDGIA